MRTRINSVPVASSRNYDTVGQRYLRRIGKAAAIAAVATPFWAVSYSVFGTSHKCQNEEEYNYAVACGLIPKKMLMSDQYANEAMRGEVFD